MEDKLQQALTHYFGYDSFRPGQEDAVKVVLEGKNAIVNLATATGKSLCYQLPAYIKGQLTLVVSPLISLMVDQLSQLKRQGEKKLAALSSLQDWRERQYILDHLADYRFIFLSPEMLFQDYIIERLRHLTITNFVVDEAHCISQWGMNFRPEYLMLGQARKKLAYPPTLALTATATDEVKKDIKQFLFDSSEEIKDIRSSVDRPNIKYLLKISQSVEEKASQLLELVQKLAKPAIVYFSSKKSAQLLCNYIKEQTDLKVELYHGDLADDDRLKIQMQFDHDQLDLICATNAFGMGVNKKNIRTVIHYHLPSSPAMYLQESGRAGRDGQDAVAVLLYRPADEQIPLYFIEEDSLDAAERHRLYQKRGPVHFQASPQERTIYYLKQLGWSIEQVDQLYDKRQQIERKQLQAMLDYTQLKSCRRCYLLSYFGQQLEKKLPACCDNCQLDLLSTYLFESTASHPRTREKQWAEIIQNLFK